MPIDPEAGTVIWNGVIAAGVTHGGSLDAAMPYPDSQYYEPILSPLPGDLAQRTNRTAFGFYYYKPGNQYTGNANGYDALIPGCYCEGWGVASMPHGAALGMSPSNSAVGVTDVSLVRPTQTRAVAITDMDLNAEPGPAFAVNAFRVTHDYTVGAIAPSILTCIVTVAVTYGTHSDVRYRRCADWDIEPTAYSEYVTIDTTGNGNGFVKNWTVDGFQSTDPRRAPSYSYYGPNWHPNAQGVFIDYLEVGPQDIGIMWEVGLGSMSAGDSYTFAFHYGAADTGTQAANLIARLRPALWSTAKPNFTSTGQPLGAPVTFFVAVGAGHAYGVPLRQRQRDDGLAHGSPRQGKPSNATSRQRSLRQSRRNTYT